MMERWQLYDQYGTKLERTLSVDQLHEIQAGQYILAVEVWIVNSQGQILLQQRSQQADVLPGYWGLTTGRVQLGEDSYTGSLREVQEELGLTLASTELAFLCRIPRQDDTHLLWDLYLVQKDVNIASLILQPQEVAQVKWVSKAEFTAMVEAGEIYQYPEIFGILERVGAR